MFHDLSIAVVVAYGIYLKLEEGYINNTWKDANISDIWTFHDILFNQMIRYRPTQIKYAGDYNIRPATQKNQASIDKSMVSKRRKIGRPSADDIQLYDFSKNLKNTSSAECAKSHMCGNLTQLDMNIKPE